MTTTELNELIIAKLGIKPWELNNEPFGVRFDYRGNRYFVDINLMVEKVDGACLVSDSDARQLEKLLRGEQWDGTGLPPVGTECEVWFKNDDSPKWYNFRALFQTEQHIVAVVGGEEISYKTSEVNSNDVKFRPLRTERDKAIEQMMSAPKPCGFAIQGICEQLYDAIVAGKIDGLGKVG